MFRFGIRVVFVFTLWGFAETFAGWFTLGFVVYDCCRFLILVVLVALVCGLMGLVVFSYDSGDV